jgi:hypothetical protein
MIRRSSRWSARARYVLAVDVPAAASGCAQLFKLVVEGLPVGACRHSRQGVVRGEFRPFLTAIMPLIGKTQNVLPAPIAPAPLGPGAIRVVVNQIYK